MSRQQFKVMSTPEHKRGTPRGADPGAARVGDEGQWMW